MPGIIFCEYRVNIREMTDTKSKSIGFVTTGNFVSILDSTKEKFKIGTADVFCKEFPFVKVKSDEGISGWVSGQFVFKILEPNRIKAKDLIKARTDFNFFNHEYQLLLGQNFGKGSVDEDGITGCEDFYPLILFDRHDKRYYLIANDGNPNSTRKHCVIIDDEGTGERIKNIKVEADTMHLKIEGIYQEGSFSYKTKIFKNNEEFVGKSFDYIRKDE
jgi:hypothetical protein